MLEIEIVLIINLTYIMRLKHAMKTQRRSFSHRQKLKNA